MTNSWQDSVDAAYVNESKYFIDFEVDGGALSSVPEGQCDSFEVKNCDVHLSCGGEWSPNPDFSCSVVNEDSGITFKATDGNLDVTCSDHFDCAFATFEAAGNIVATCTGNAARDPV